MKSRALAGAASHGDSFPFSPNVEAQSPRRRASSSSNPHLAADLRELLSLTAKIKVAQSGDLEDPAVAEELRAVEREWQRFKATRARRRQP
jgi:ribosomal 50S subunit-associated protein YjgA (DUF615 family)